VSKPKLEQEGASHGLFIFSTCSRYVNKKNSEQHGVGLPIIWAGLTRRVHVLTLV
jgi:hypothetical protein